MMDSLPLWVKYFTNGRPGRCKFPMLVGEIRDIYPCNLGILRYEKNMVTSRFTLYLPVLILRLKDQIDK